MTIYELIVKLEKIQDWSDSAQVLIKDSGELKEIKDITRIKDTILIETE